MTSHDHIILVVAMWAICNVITTKLECRHVIETLLAAIEKQKKETK